MAVFRGSIIFGSSFVDLLDGFTVMQVTGAVPFSQHDPRAQITPSGDRAMFNPSDLLFTSSDFAKIAVVVILSFVGTLLAYVSVAAIFA
jgi:hypothetical protein